MPEPGPQAPPDDPEVAGSRLAGTSDDPHGAAPCPPALPEEPRERELRQETEIERLDRHWLELLQELRVVQTGVQILSAFLLTIPFQQRFGELSDGQRGIYLVAVSLGVLATGLIIAPVSIHRLLFRRQERPILVRQSDLLAKLGLVALACCLTASITLIASFVVGTGAALLAAAACIVFFLVVWLGVPLIDTRNQRRASGPPGPPAP